MTAGRAAGSTRREPTAGGTERPDATRPSAVHEAPELCRASLVELGELIERRVVSPIEVVEAHLHLIERLDHLVHAFVTVIAEEAIARARDAETRAATGSRLSPLDGVPVALKDLFDFKPGVRNTFGSLLTADFVPPRAAVTVERLERAGLIVLGKTNVPEFGHRGTTDNAVVGPTSTPFCIGKNAGGSSGGSAAAVAAGMAPAALGSDGAGSIRIPASLCGVVGFKPSFGRVPSISRPTAFRRHGLLSQGGPLTRTVQDAAVVTRVLAGTHPRDPMCVPTSARDFDMDAHAGRPIRVAYSPDLGLFPVDASVARVAEEAVADLDASGIPVVPVSVQLRVSYPELSAVLLRGVGLTMWDILLGLERDIPLFDPSRVGDGSSPELVSLLVDLEQLHAGRLREDEIARTLVFDAVSEILEHFDYLITPTVGVDGVDNASDGRTVGPAVVGGRTVEPLLGWSLAFPFNFTGHPVISIPAGLSDRFLPVGLQVVGGLHDDAGVLALGRRLEQMRPWRHRLGVVACP